MAWARTEHNSIETFSLRFENVLVEVYRGTFCPEVWVWSAREKGDWFSNGRPGLDFEETKSHALAYAISRMSGHKAMRFRNFLETMASP